MYPSVHPDLNTYLIQPFRGLQHAAIARQPVLTRMAHN
jgi:hypothetical protein